MTVRSARWLTALAAAVLAGCREEPAARILLAEFQDESPDGVARQDETIVLQLEQPLAGGFDPALVRVESEHLAGADLEAVLSESPRRLALRIRTGTPQFRFEGVYGRDPLASGLVIDLGDGVRQAVDLQLRRPVPRLVRATWVDAAPPGGNGVVDRGDRIRLQFSHKVRLAAGGDRTTVKVPQHIELTKDNADRLDDGQIPSVFAASATGADDEIDVVLGSRPVLKVEGVLPEDPLAIDRDSNDAPSGLAINGTDIRPMDAIVARAGGAGVGSNREVDIEMPEDLVEKLESRRHRTRWPLPDDGAREQHTLTPFEGYAIVTGGIDLSGASPRALDDVVVFAARGTESGDFRRVQEPLHLPRALYRHTATLLPGADRKPGTRDDIVLLAGGLDANGETVPDLTAIIFSESSEDLIVLPLDTALQIPRAEHAAAAVRHDQVLVDGGRTADAVLGREGLVEAAELLTLRREGDRIRIEEQVLFRTLARKRHTLTFLGSDHLGGAWALAYGGVGRNRSKDRDRPDLPFGTVVDPDAPESIFPESEACVLYSPVLISLSRPGESLDRLPYELEYAFLRHGHRALGLGEMDEEGLVAARQVLVSGGSLVHPDFGMEGDIPELWEITRLEFLHKRHQKPHVHLPINGLLFRFDAENPVASPLAVVRHPALTPARVLTREAFSMTHVPGLGVVIAGGEAPGEGGEPILHSSVEVYFTEGEHRGELRELAYSLRLPRSRHEAFLVEHAGERTLVLVGGRVPPGAGAESGVEELPIPGTSAENP